MIARALVFLSLFAAPLAPAAAQSVPVTCGAFVASWTVTGNTAQWTIARGKDRAVETAHLRTGPKFGCIGDAALSLEYGSTTGNAVLELHFADGNVISYARQHVDKRGERWILPVQARRRVPPELRGAFDYHCKFDTHLDPISAEARTACAPAG
jgi:hypothetical protein